MSTLVSSYFSHRHLEITKLERDPPAATTSDLAATNSIIIVVILGILAMQLRAKAAYSIPKA